MPGKRALFHAGGSAVLLAMLAVPANGANTIFSCHETGIGQHFMRVCLSREGNVLEFKFPEGTSQLMDRIFHEGYAVCYSFPGYPTKVAYDDGFRYDGWGPATISGTPNQFPLTITRTTTDGALQLKQTFSWNAARHELFIDIVVTNLSGTRLNWGGFSRYFNANFYPNNAPPGTPEDDLFDRTDRSVMAQLYGNRTSGSSGNPGMSLTRLTDNGSVAIHSFAEWRPDKCAQYQSMASPTPRGDWVGRTWTWPYSMVAGRTETIRLVYRHN
jgi:hypothetical protein